MLMNMLHVEGLRGLTGKRKKKKREEREEETKTRILYPVSVPCSK
jgi:hypothetical protein